jgi:hypothetical protein
LHNPLRMQENHLAPETAEFYRSAMRALQAAKAPFLVGGAYAFARYTGIERHTKDFDIFVRRRDLGHVMETLAALGCRTEIKFPHWLAKAHRGDDFVDVIYSSGNGIAVVDDVWFEKSVPCEVLGVPTVLIPAEEMIWSKGFLMERERFDGADVAHVLHSRAEKLDWERLLRRFGDRWRVLLAHLVLFGFVYPGERSRIPAGVMRTLLDRLGSELESDSDNGRVCHGTVISRQQYLSDIDRGFKDARAGGNVLMNEEDIALFTRGIAEDGAR